jgi:Carboxypeptidase regulatory-like domain
VRRILLSRFVVVPLVIAVLIGAWNIYVSLHDHGLLAGRVVDASGRPIANATVILFTHDFVTQVEKARTATDANGAFRFDHNDSHLVQLQAQDGNQSSRRITIRLWFRAQDRVLRKPLVLTPRA